MKEKKWYESTSFYHIYPLGFCGDEIGKTKHPLGKITRSLDYIAESGFKAIYLGPLFESISHGYDTTDFFKVDSRLGNNDDLRDLIQKAHERGIKVVLDGVFNHIGREFFAFRDLQQRRENSEYKDWFSLVNFNSNNHHNDGFSYDTWEAHEELVKLNLKNPHVKKHIFDAIRFWIDDFGIDGLRLDAADCLDLDFLREMRTYTVQIKDDFWLMGEIIHGDYRKWAGEEILHSVTNYECYKGMYSSFNDKNFFEIAHSLNRQYGPEGSYKDIQLYNFVDNHDVDRIRTKLILPVNLYPLHILLYSIPGIPSIYYGSEWAREGKRTDHSDIELRPVFDRAKFKEESEFKDLYELIKKMNEIKLNTQSLLYGDYTQIYVNHQQLIFKRETETQIAFIGINSSEDEFDYYLENEHSLYEHSLYEDILNGKKIEVENNTLKMKLFPKWGSIIVANKN